MVFHRFVGVMLSGAPSQRDPLGVLAHQRSGSVELTFRPGIILVHRVLNDVRMARVKVMTEHGDVIHDMPRDETKLTAPSWHLYVPDIPDLP